MYSRQCLSITALLIFGFLGRSSALAQSALAPTYFTLQVASFPNRELANKFLVQLEKAGEHPTCAAVELQARGSWTRVFVGLFATADAARRYGDNLKAREIIVEFLVRKADLNQAVARTGRVIPNGAGPSEVSSRAQSRRPMDEPILSSFIVNDDASMRLRLKEKTSAFPGAYPEPVNRVESALPVLTAAIAKLAPALDTSCIPRPDPVTLAFGLVLELNSVSETSRGRGGLWVTGDIAEGLSRLRWIAGEENAGLVTLDEGGRVQLDRRVLAKAAGLRAARVEDPLRVADYIGRNEGLLLLVQLTEGNYRYLLHIGNQVPTRGRRIEISGDINLDNNYDSRINPYRKHGRKLDEERPPEGFAAVVGLNPVAQWFNLRARCWVPVGEIILHELAEAHAKVALGLDYLEQGSSAGAHAVALERERRLKSQRPDADIVLTAGSNRVLRTQQEIRQFYAESAGDIGKQ